MADNRIRVRNRDIYIVEDEGRVVLKNTHRGYLAYKTQTFSRAASPDLELRLRRCLPEEIDDIMHIQDKVIEKVPDRYSYVVTCREDVAESLSHDICLGAYHRINNTDRLVGFTILLALRDTERHLSHCLEYQSEYKRVCTTNDGTWIDPEYQGYGLQFWFSREKDLIARSMGAVELLACTSPVNYACQKTLSKNGYRVIAEKLLYGGYPRLIFSKKITA
jgi:hypothetical protein